MKMNGERPSENRATAEPSALCRNVGCSLFLDSTQQAEFDGGIF